MRLVGFMKVKGKPTRLLLEVADTPENISELAKPNGYLAELIVTDARIRVEEQ